MGASTAASLFAFRGPSYFLGSFSELSLEAQLAEGRRQLDSMPHFSGEGYSQDDLRAVCLSRRDGLSERQTMLHTKLLQVAHPTVLEWLWTRHAGSQRGDAVALAFAYFSTNCLATHVSSLETPQAVTTFLDAVAEGTRSLSEQRDPLDMP